MDENITAKNISRRFSGIQHTILGWNDKELDDDLFVFVFPIDYESCCSYAGWCHTNPTVDGMKFINFTCLKIEQNHTSSCSLPILTYESILGFS